MKKVSLFTDGACSGNPGPGGWAFILRCSTTEKELERSDEEAALRFVSRNVWSFWWD